MEEDASMVTDYPTDTNSPCDERKCTKSTQERAHNAQMINAPVKIPELSRAQGTVLNEPTQCPACKCNSCGSNWQEVKYSAGCLECDGFPLVRPCAICHGACGNMWKRNVDQSNRTGRGSWIGTCDHQRQAALRHSQLRVHQVTDAMEMLSTGRK